MTESSPIAPCWAILVNAGLLVEEPAPELVCATRIGADRAIVRFTDGSSVEREL